MGVEDFHPDNHGGNRYLEIWNLVFSELNHNPDDSYTPLPTKNIDTGAGLERLTMILQGVNSTFETDLFVPIIRELEKVSFIPYNNSKESITAYHSICDHIRSVVMMIHDGERPSNTERGYIIRRLIRRSMRLGRKIGHNEPFLYQLVSVVIEQLKETEPTLIQSKEMLQSVIRNEENRFMKVLTKGERIIHRQIKRLKDKEIFVLSGDIVFSLYDTHGFPVDMTEEICKEENMEIDRKRFDDLLFEQQKKSKK